jgi:hypothetical protein
MTIKTVKQSLLSAECWSVQAWGLSQCETCDLKDTRDCGGKKIRKTGKNSNGVKIGENGFEEEGEMK